MSDEGAREARVVTPEFKGMPPLAKLETMILHGLIDGDHPGVIALRADLQLEEEVALSRSPTVSEQDRVAAGQGERLREALEEARQYIERKSHDAFDDREDGLLSLIDAALATPSPLYACLDDLRDYIARTHGKDHPLVEKAGKVMGL